MKSNEIEQASCEKNALFLWHFGMWQEIKTGVCHKYVTWNTALQWMWNMSWVFCFSLWRMYSASDGVFTSVSRQHRPGATQSAWCWRCYIKQTLHTSAAWWVPVVSFCCCLLCFAVEFWEISFTILHACFKFGVLDGNEVLKKFNRFGKTNGMDLIKIFCFELSAYFGRDWKLWIASHPMKWTSSPLIVVMIWMLLKKGGLHLTKDEVPPFIHNFFPTHLQKF